jgi:hypothetical protein
MSKPSFVPTVAIRSSPSAPARPAKSPTATSGTATMATMATSQRIPLPQDRQREIIWSTL